MKTPDRGPGRALPTSRSPQADTTPIPQCVGTIAERVIAARGHPLRLKRLLARSVVPIVVVDDRRRYLEVNVPARLAFRLSVAELRRRRIDDLTPPEMLSVTEAAWERLMSSGCVAGPYEVSSPDGSRFAISYYALANVLPGRHVIAFAPEWTDDGELLLALDEIESRPPVPLTPREVQVLELAAEGHAGPAIARKLIVSNATVKTHFEHIYTKLDVSDRGAAVARAMRLGLIA